MFIYFFQQHCSRKRLEQVIDNPSLDALDHRITRSISADHDHWRISAMMLQIDDEIRAICFLKMHITDNQIDIGGDRFRFGRITTG